MHDGLVINNKSATAVGQCFKIGLKAGKAASMLSLRGTCTPTRSYSVGDVYTRNTIVCVSPWVLPAADVAG